MITIELTEEELDTLKSVVQEGQAFHHGNAEGYLGDGSNRDYHRMVADDLEALLAKLKTYG